ncbi:hypothetical protein BDR22DRAFT_884789 [Usnea florida]
MSRPGLRSGNTGIAPSEHEHHSEHEEETPVAASLQAFVAASNKVLMYEMRVLVSEAITAAMDAKIGSEQQQLTPPAQSFPSSPGPQLRAEEVGYFDREYQQERGSSESNGPVVNAGKHVFYKDVYIFTNPLKDLAVQRGEADIKAVIASCLRASALMWYSMELTELERDELRDTNLDHWYTTLIKRFKTRTAVALSQLVGQTYTLIDIRHATPRAFIQHMLHVAKSAEIHSTHNQLTPPLVSSWINQPAPKDPTPSRYGSDQRPPQRQQHWSRNCAQQQRLLPAPPNAKAHFVDPQQEQ